MAAHDSAAHAVRDAAAAGVASHWRASLTLHLARHGARTVLAHQAHTGPVRVQRVFYPEAGLPHVYLLHPPGVVVGGDELDIGVRCGPGAHALVTTRAANKLYRSAGPAAV